MWIAIKKIFFSYKFLCKKNSCKILRFNLEKKQVSFIFRGIETSVCMPIFTAVFDHAITSSLTARECASLAYEYAKKIENESESDKKFNFFNKELQSALDFCGLDRKGYLILKERRTGGIIRQAPLDIMKKNNILSQLNTGQALYVGILAGFAFRKSEKKGYG